MSQPADSSGFDTDMEHTEQVEAEWDGVDESVADGDEFI